VFSVDRAVKSFNSNSTHMLHFRKQNGNMETVEQAVGLSLENLQKRIFRL